MGRWGNRQLQATAFFQDIVTDYNDMKYNNTKIQIQTLVVA